jgi:hydroxymethylbilane synthase
MASKRLRVGVPDLESGHLHGTWLQEQLETRHPELKVALREVGSRPRGTRTSASGATIPIREFHAEPVYQALTESKVDLGVHRMKDIPHDIPPGVELVAVTERKTPLDVLVTADGAILDDLPEGARIGVSSLRRQAQISRYRPDLEIEFVVGSLSERLHLVDSGRLKGIVVAAAGIEWRGWQDRVSEVLTTHLCIPAVGQASLGILVREGDEEIAAELRFLNHTMSSREVTAERAFHKAIGAWEGAPVGALARVRGDILKIEGCVISMDGKQILRGLAEGFPDDPIRTGERLARMLLDRGAAGILAQDDSTSQT